jgi:disulfide bond formation protein DsbB
MMEINPLFDVIRKVLSAPGDCANIDWSFLGLAMPAWVLLWSLLLGTVGVLTNWPRRTAG